MAKHTIVEYIIDKTNIIMKTSFILLILILVNCDKYETIFSGLSKNYILLHGKLDKNLYDEYFKSDKLIYERDSIQYMRSINEFYSADTGIIECLLKYENDEKICDWIITKDPYSSSIHKGDYITRSEGALILLDNYLSNPHLKQSITVRPYVKNMSFQEFTKFYSINKTLDKKELMKRYKIYIGSMVLH